MSFRHIDSYFENEDQALEALIKIQILGGTQCLIEQLEHENDENVFAISSYVGSASTIGTGGGISGTNTIPNIPTRRSVYGGNEKGVRKAMLSFQIPPDKEKQSLDIITEYGGWLH